MLRILLGLPLLLLAPAALAQGFPQRFEGRHGPTVVEAQPERVVSLDFGGLDTLLALGVEPVAVRDWYGDQPFGAWPWARGALGDREPVLLGYGEVSIEQVAALDPDLILAQAAGLSEEQALLLSQVAPVIMPAPGVSDFGTSWQERALTVGRATGRLAEAERQVAAIEARLAEAREAHPGWQGQSAVAAYLWSGQPGAYRSLDVRAQVLEGLGFVTPPAVDAAGGEGSFYVALSPEDLRPLDAGVLLWIADDPGALDDLRALPLRPSLRAHREGREVYVDPLLSGAFSSAPLRSLPFALDRLVPLIEAAADGDPGTPVPSSVAAGLAP